MKTAKDFILKHWNPEVIPGECEVKHFFDEMDRVMQLYYDQQNKELMEKVKALDDHRIKIEEMEWTERKRANKAEVEIQRLTKEVEELKQQVTPSGILQAKTNKELTRLRELLRKAKEYIEIYGSSGDEIDFDELIDNIDNALNPKP